MATCTAHPKSDRLRFPRYLNGHLDIWKKKDRFTLAGDFNAPHTNWGYRTNTKKGRNLVEAVEKYNMQLETLPLAPTGLGNSDCGYTYPDVTFTFNVKEGHRRNLDENLGSECYITSYSTTTPKFKKPFGNAKITDWTAYRYCPIPQHLIHTIEEWVDEMVQAYLANTKHVALSEKTPVVDPHLIHL